MQRATFSHDVAGTIGFRIQQGYRTTLAIGTQLVASASLKNETNHSGRELSRFVKNAPSLGGFDDWHAIPFIA
jgi:hypothetical protein